MTALTKARQTSFETWNEKQFTLASGNKAFKGGLAAIDLSTGKVEPAHSAEADLFVFGTFTEDVDATSADKLVNVRFDREVKVRWFVNSGTAALASTDVGKLCYAEDDQTVTASPNSASPVGRVWAVSSTDGVAVELLPSGVLSTNALPPIGTLAAFSANNINVPASPATGTLYDVPTTAGVSTITLPATADQGCTIRFFADGTKNGHTVQYRDATGPTNLTAALTASKRHLVTAVYLGTGWACSSDVAP